MGLVDYLGRPVKTGDLTTELASASLSSIRQPWHDSVANFLTPSRLASVLAAVDQGDTFEYLTLAEEMEERDLHYASVLNTRKLSVSSREIVIEACSDDPEDVDIAEFLQEVVKGECFADLLADLTDAIGKSFSVCEIMWSRDANTWEPGEFKWRDGRFFQFDRETGQELRLRDEADPANGIPLAPYKFVQHRPKIKTGLPMRGGLARLAAVAFMAKGYALKDWLAFAEVYGMPVRVGKYPSSATPDQKAKLLSAVANIGTDAAAIIPDSMIIEFVEASKTSGSEIVFKALADYLDAQVSKGVLGQTMTTDNGSSLSQAQVHNEVRKDIRDFDAKQLAATLRRDVIRPMVDLNFGPRKEREYPTVTLFVEEEADLESLSRSLPPFIDRGLKVQSSVLLDKFGIPAAEDGAEVLTPAKGGGSSSLAPGGEVPPMPGQEAPGATPEDTNPEDTNPEDGAQPAEPGDQPPGMGADAAKSALLARVVAGGTLTSDQRLLLAVLARSSGDDMIDELASTALGGWRKVMDPVLEPLIKLAETAKTKEEFEKGLAEMSSKMKPDELVRALATMTFTARGMGNATDKIRKA